MTKKVIVAMVTVVLCGGVIGGCGGKESPAPAEELKLDARGLPPRGGPVVARYGGKTVTQKELEYQISQLPEESQAQAKTLMGLKSFINNYVDRKLFLEEIEARPTDPEIERQARLYRENLLIQSYLDRELKKRIITEQAAKKHYEKNKDKYMTPMMVRAANILIKVAPDASPEDRQAARERAEAVLKRVRKGEDFAALAREFSEDEVTAKRGGDMSYLPPGRLPPELDTVVFSMEKEGEVSDVVESRMGYHVLKCLGRKKPQQVSYNQVREQILESLGPSNRRAAYQDLAQELREARSVRIENSVLLRMIAGEAMKKTAEELGITPPAGTAPVEAELTGDALAPAEKGEE